MKDEIVLNGIVLSSGLQGEYDRRLVILTREQGKITAFAKGVRRPSSQLISKTQLFVMGAFTVYPGRNAYTLINVDAKEYFHELTFDMNKYCYGSYFCEMMSYFTREGDRSADYLNLLFVSLNALKKGLLPVKLIRCVYELKIMDIFGQGLQSFHCPICGSDRLTRIFDPLSGVRTAGARLRKVSIYQRTPDMCFSILMEQRLEICIISRFQTACWKNL